MAQLIIPDFRTLLALNISAIPKPSQPAFLAVMERSAAGYQSAIRAECNTAHTQAFKK